MLGVSPKRHSAGEYRLAQTSPRGGGRYVTPLGRQVVAAAWVRAKDRRGFTHPIPAPSFMARRLGVAL